MVKIEILAAVLSASIVFEGVCSLPEGISPGKSEPACLLQSTFASSDLTLDEEEKVDFTDVNPKSAILFESDVSEEMTTKELMTRSQTRSQSCKAHLAYMERKVHGLENARNVSNRKMDELIDGFISKQSGSQDACSSQLMEAKHQSNQIHEYVMDLVVQVNTTELAILALDKAMQDKIKEIEALDKWKEEELNACEEKRQQYIEMYGKLTDEMKEMKQIASPGVAMDVKTGTIITAEKVVGLIQLPAHIGSVKTEDMRELQLFIKDTQSAAKQFLQCMSQKTDEKPDISQMQRSVVVGSFEVRDVTDQAPEFKMSKKKQSCEESYGWDTATVAQVAEWCGCDIKKRNEKNWCTCQDKLKPLIGNRGQWLLVGLKGGQAMGWGYKYSVKFAPKDAAKTALDLCTPPALVPATVEAETTTTPRTIIHVDPPEAIGGGLQAATQAPMTTTTPPTYKHVDPPKAVGAGDAMQVATQAPVTTPPTYKHVDDLGDLGDDREVGNEDGSNFGAGFTPAIGGMTADDLRSDENEATDAAAAAIKAGAASPEKCAEEKKILEETYVKTYVELSRLKNEYDELANSTACFDTVESTYKSRKVPLQEAIDKLIKDIDKKTRELQALRPRLESATKAETELRKHIATLSQECDQLPDTVSNLNKVRDAIQALSKCPGLSRVQFSLPKWIGTWINVPLKAKNMKDEEQDETLNNACAGKVGGARAAEVGEIEEQTVEGIPLTNTADFPLIGTCPNCEGDESNSFPSGHKRICWRQGKDLNHKAKSTNCAAGKKAILCVIDREDIREIPGDD